jgi:hypothetical protein
MEEEIGFRIIKISMPIPSPSMGEGAGGGDPGLIPPNSIFPHKWGG